MASEVDPSFVKQRNPLFCCACMYTGLGAYLQSGKSYKSGLCSYSKPVVESSINHSSTSSAELEKQYVFPNALLDRSFGRLVHLNPDCVATEKTTQQLESLQDLSALTRLSTSWRIFTMV